VNWRDPEARAALLEQVGPTEYRRLHAQSVDRSTVGYANGYRLVQVGELVAVDGTRRAFRSEDQARTYADRQPPAERGSAWVLQ
jgi:hypothetical protein